MNRIKTQRRQSILSSRQSFPDTYVLEVSTRVRERLKSLSVWGGGQRVHVYLPIAGQHEIDTWSVVEWLHEKGYEVWTSYLPKDSAEDGFCQVDIDTTYDIGRYGIPLPRAEIAQDCKPDIIVVPCLASDIKGNRLGYGSGWYDWFLSDRVEATRIGLVYDEFLFENIPNDSHDQKLDMIITEKQILKCERRK